MRQLSKEIYFRLNKTANKVVVVITIIIVIHQIIKFTYHNFVPSRTFSDLAFQGVSSLSTSLIIAPSILSSSSILNFSQSGIHLTIKIHQYESQSAKLPKDFLFVFVSDLLRYILPQFRKNFWFSRQ